jgi:PAS domain S-box-containing protein
VVGVNIDISERKLTETALAERNLQLAMAGKVGRVGSYAYDVNAEKLQVSEGYAALHGLPEGTTEIALGEWQARVHPEDLDRVQGVHNQAVADKQRDYSVEYRIVRSNGEVRWTERRCSIVYDGDARPQRVVGVSIDITERKQAEKQRNMLNAELDHRVKNALATVSSVISQTRKGSQLAAEFAAALEGRIRSMAATHELLSAHWWQGVSLSQLARRELAPYAGRDNTEVSGPEVMLRAEAGQAIAMVLHELATNAAKYGALSTRSGRVSIRWDQRLNGRPRPDLTLEWREIGGPPVSVPGNSGYGTSTIRDLIPYEFDGTVDLLFAPDGVRCRLRLPAEWISDAADPYDPGSGVIAGAAAK